LTTSVAERWKLMRELPRHAENNSPVFHSTQFDLPAELIR
jgi:hypothetical protein